MSEYRVLARKLIVGLHQKDWQRAILLIAVLPFITGSSGTEKHPLAPHLCNYVSVDNIGVNTNPTIPESLKKYEKACDVINAINGIKFSNTSHSFLCKVRVSRGIEWVEQIEKDPEAAMEEKHLSMQNIEAHKRDEGYKKSYAMLEAFGHDFVADALHRKTANISGSSHWGTEFFTVIFLMDDNFKPIRMLKTLDDLDSEHVMLQTVEDAILWGRMHLKISDNLCSVSYQKTKLGWILEDVPLNERCHPPGTKTLAISFDGRIETLSEQKSKNQRCSVHIE